MILDDKKILDSQLKQVYKTKRELDKEVRALKDTNIKMKAAQQTHMDSVRKVTDEELKTYEMVLEFLEVMYV